MSTGFPESDAAAAFARERRRQALAKLAFRARRRDDVTLMLPFEDVVGALGRTGERNLGLQSIALESVVGTVDRRAGEFDRSFRPASSRPRRRWEGIAVARRRGRSMPPIDVYRIGSLHSSSTVITACRSLAPTAIPTSTPTCARCRPASL